VNESPRGIFINKVNMFADNKQSVNNKIILNAGHLEQIISLEMESHRFRDRVTVLENI